MQLLDQSQQSRSGISPFSTEGDAQTWICAGNISLLLRHRSRSSSQAVMGAALPAEAVGWDWLVAQPWAQPPKITQECKSLLQAQHG